MAIFWRTFAWEERRWTGARDCQCFSQRTTVPNPAEFSHMVGEGRRGDGEPCADQRLQSSRGRGRVWFPESSEEMCFPPESPAWTLPNACPSIPGPAKGHHVDSGAFPGCLEPHSIGAAAWTACLQGCSDESVVLCCLWAAVALPAPGLTWQVEQWLQLRGWKGADRFSRVPWQSVPLLIAFY